MGLGGIEDGCMDTDMDADMDADMDEGIEDIETELEGDTVLTLTRLREAVEVCVAGNDCTRDCVGEKGAHPTHTGT